MSTQRIAFGRPTPSQGCACGCADGSGSSSAAPTTASGADTTVVRVTGMTCAHCVRAVTEELTSLDTVTGVDVDLRVGDASIVRVTSTAPLDPEAVTAAIDEAGYAVAP